MAKQTLVVVDLLTHLLYLNDNYATGSTTTGVSKRESGVSWSKLESG